MLLWYRESSSHVRALHTHTVNIIHRHTHTYTHGLPVANVLPYNRYVSVLIPQHLQVVPGALIVLDPGYAVLGVGALRQNQTHRRRGVAVPVTAAGAGAGRGL